MAMAADCTKSVRWSDDAPYAFRGLDGELKGLHVDTVRAALKRMGCVAQFLERPWARALVELEEGHLDILPGVLRRPEREVYAYFSRPVNRSPNVLFMRKAAAEKYKITKLADVLGTSFRLGAQMGVAYGPSFEALQKDPRFTALLTPFTARRGAWQMMDMDRLDGLIADEITGLLELQELGLSSVIVKTPLVTTAEPGMFALSKKSLSPQFAAEFDRALEAMVKDGELRQIRERYVPCPVSADQIGCK
jgi:polar amino acid transport system substrate-binding protein